MYAYTSDCRRNGWEACEYTHSPHTYAKTHTHRNECTCIAQTRAFYSRSTGRRRRRHRGREPGLCAANLGSNINFGLLCRESGTDMKYAKTNFQPLPPPPPPPPTRSAPAMRRRRVTAVAEKKKSIFSAASREIFCAPRRYRRGVLNRKRPENRSRTIVVGRKKKKTIFVRAPVNSRFSYDDENRRNRSYSRLS